MGIGEKIVNRTIDITGMLAKKALSDGYEVGKVLTKMAFKATCFTAKHSAKFSVQAIKYFTKRAKQYHAEKQLSKREVLQSKPLSSYKNVSFDNVFEEPKVQQQKQVQIQQQVQQKVQPQVQKKNNVIYAEQFQRQTGKEMYSERKVHIEGFRKLENFHQELLDSGYLSEDQQKKVKQVSSLLKEEKKMLEGNKVYKNSEYYSKYDYENNTDVGYKKGLKEAVRFGDVKSFKEEYTEKYEIARVDISNYYQRIEKTKDLEEKAFWTGRLENYVATNKETLVNNGLGEKIEGIKPSKDLTKTEKLDMKLKKLEGLKKGMKANEEIKKKVAAMPKGNSKIKGILESKLGPSGLDMFFETDQAKQAYRESEKQRKIEAKRHAEREVYF
ncbi:hypothetical protein ACS2QQ_27330 [Bacillus cereus group sp. Bce032]|uniref:hypothetical protein n=1 Tax=Bacillus cereus group sp. Bce032 TaxID=3445236 RepID=UPI003F21DAE9